MNNINRDIMMCFGRKSQRIAPASQQSTVAPGPVTSAYQDHVVDDVGRIADTLVSNSMISKDEANKQVDAIRLFREGKMSYAEMRMIAG